MNAFSMRQRSRETLAEAEGCFLLQRFGITGLVPRSSSSSRNSAPSYASSPSIRFAGFTLRIRRSAIGQSCASPPVNKMARRRPLASAKAYLRVAPSARAAHSLVLLPPFPPAAQRCAFTCAEFHHLCVCGSSVSSSSGTGFPRRHAAPSAQSDYRSLSEVHTRAGIGTSDSRFSEHARCR